MDLYRYLKGELSIFSFLDIYIDLWISMIRFDSMYGYHRAFSDGYQGESIEHSLMDPKREGGAQNAQQYVLLETRMLALQLPVGLS